MSLPSVVPSDTGDSSSRKLPVAAAGAAFVMAATMGLTAPFVVLKTPLPYMATPKHKVRKALQFLASRNKCGSVFCDLGSGDGEAVYQAALMGHYHKAIGYEVNWTLWGLSQIRRYCFWKSDIRSSTQFYCRDFFSTSIPPNTCTVMVFGVSSLMIPLSQKLATELPVGSQVLSYRFPLPLLNQQNDVSLLNAKVIYSQEEMRVYEVVGDDGSNASETTLGDRKSVS